MKKVILIVVVLVALVGCSAPNSMERLAQDTKDAGGVGAQIAYPPEEEVIVRQTEDLDCTYKFETYLKIVNFEGDAQDRGVDEWVSIFEQYKDPDAGAFGYLGLCVQEGWLPTLPELKQLTTKDIFMELIVIEKKCFGSAGCLVTVVPEIRFFRVDVPTNVFDFSKDVMIVYTINGVEDGDMVDNLTILAGGEQYKYSEVMYSTARESDILTATITLIR